MKMKKYKAIEYGRMACETIMQTYDAAHLPPYYDDGKDVPMFSYHQGVFLSGMNRIYQKTKEKTLINYMKDWVDSTLDENGKIIENGGWVSLGTLDFRQPGIIMFPLYDETKDERYMDIVKYLVESLKDFPTNSVGGFWHMTTQEYQMWLDGLYMAGPVLAMYAEKFNKPEFFEIVINQIIVMYENMLDVKSGLMVHGWDESKAMGWADPVTGKSQEIWGRAMGWYVTAIADILDYIPENYEKRDYIIEIERTLLEAIVKYQDSESGRWYEVVDKGDCDGNWLENSCSCLFVYALSKAIKKGYIEDKYYESAKKGYEGVINSLEYDDNGRLLVGDICIGTCIDEGTYEHYINRPTCINDLHGSGAFTLMCSEFDER